MFILRLWRFWLSLAAAALVYALVLQSVPVAAAAGVTLRLVLWGLQRLVDSRRITACFRAHASAFRQEFGPYGIRIINKAETQRHIRASLAEVFTPNPATLRRNVEQLEMLDTLFSAGLRPEGDDYLLHDLKLKYGRKRLEQPDRQTS